MARQELKRGRNWYALQTYSGYEDAVRTALLQRIESLNMQDYIFDVVVPKVTEIESKRGEAHEIKKKIFPGYILVDMIVNDKSWYVVRNTPHVTGFIGAGNTPVPIHPDEFKHIQKVIGGEGEAKYKVEFAKGDIVRITDGPFNSYEGLVKDIDEHKGKVRVMVSIFGRDTSMELDFTQVKKV